MNWGNDWWVFLLILLVPLIVWGGVSIWKKIKGNKRKRLVPPISTIQGAYVPSPQYNPAYQSQNVYPQKSIGWNVTNLDQLGTVNVRTVPEGTLIVQREPVQYNVPIQAYEKPPPYNPNA